MDIVDKANNLYIDLVNEVQSIKKNEADRNDETTFSIAIKALDNITKLIKVIKIIKKNYPHIYATSVYSVSADDTINTLHDIEALLLSEGIPTYMIFGELFCYVGKYIGTLNSIKSTDMDIKEGLI